MTATLLAVLCVLSQSQTSAPRRVMVLPLEAQEGVTKDQAAQMTSALLVAATRIPNHQVTALKDVEGALSQAQLNALTGCTNTSCIAEVSAALNVEEVLTGTLGRVDDAYMVSLTRVQTRDAVALGRALKRTDSPDLGPVLDLAPALVAELYGIPADAPPQVVKTRAAEPKPATNMGMRKLVGLVVAAVGAPVLLVSAVVFLIGYLGVVLGHLIALDPGGALISAIPVLGAVIMSVPDFDNAGSFFAGLDLLSFGLQLVGCLVCGVGASMLAAGVVAWALPSSALVEEPPPEPAK